jgi:hypothetical protein
LNPVASNSKSTANKTVLDNLGTIEVVVLRCQDDPAIKPRKDPYDFPRLSKFGGLGSAPSPISNRHESGDLGGDDDNGIFSLFDGAGDERPRRETGLDGQEKSDCCYQHDIRSPIARISSRRPNYSYVTTGEFGIPEYTDTKSSSDEGIVVFKRPSRHYAQQSATPAYLNERPNSSQPTQSSRHFRRPISPRGSASKNASNHNFQPHSSHRRDPTSSSYYTNIWGSQDNESAQQEPLSPHKPGRSDRAPARERASDDDLQLEEMRYRRALEERKLEERRLDVQRLADERNVEKHREEAQALQKEIRHLKLVKQLSQQPARVYGHDQSQYAMLPNKRGSSALRSPASPHVYEYSVRTIPMNRRCSELISATGTIPGGNTQTTRITSRNPGSKWS